MLSSLLSTLSLSLWLMAGAPSSSFLSSLFSSSSSSKHSSSDDHTVVWGHRIPLPQRDLVAALATVALFLPAVVLVHRCVAALLRLLGTAKQRRTD